MFAAQLAALWGGEILTAASLASPGWQWFFGAGAPPGRLPLGDRVIDGSALQGVLTCLSCVTPDELPFISATERSYVSSEMNAFLMAWLSSLSCPVLNPPSPVSLSGPGWRLSRWLATASSVGLPVVSQERNTAHDAVFPAATLAVQVVGEAVFNAPDDEFVGAALRLSRIANSPLLSLWCVPQEGRLAVCGVNPGVDLHQPHLANATHALLLGSER